MISNGLTFTYPPGQAVLASSYGALFCSSGLAVPVPNATGYTAGLGVCVASLDLTGVGLPCGTYCPWTGDVLSDLRANPSGNLVCAPVAQPGLPCAWLPSSLYDFAAVLPGYLAAQACLSQAAGPTGVRCPGNGRGAPSAGSCGYYRCLAVVIQGALNPSPAVSPYWTQAFPGVFDGSSSGGGGGSNQPPCVSAVAASIQAWEAELPQDTACAYALPPAFKARRWTCAAGTAVTLSPSPAPPSTPTATPSQTVTTGLTRTATPTQSVSVGLTPTASPQYTRLTTPTATPTQTVTTGLTPTATPTQTVTTGLTPTASPQWAPAPAPASSAGTGSSAAPSAGVVAGAVIGALVGVALLAAAGLWAFWQFRLRHPPVKLLVSGGGLIVTANPAMSSATSWRA